jgi:multidrug efflux system outer membrane protein
MSVGVKHAAGRIGKIAAVRTIGRLSSFLCIAVTIAAWALPSEAAPAVSAAPAAVETAAPAFDANATVRYALEHSATVLAKRATLASALATFTRDRAAELPTLTGQLANQSTRSSNAQGNLAAYGLAQSNFFSQNTAQIGSQYTLYNGSLTQLQAQEARRQVEGARADLRRTEQQTAADATSAFYNLAAKRTAVSLADSNLRYQAALLEAARVSERVGRAAGVDVLRADVARTRGEAALVTAKAAEEDARESLALQIGAPLLTQFIVPEEIPEPKLPETPVDVLISIAQQNRPDVAAARANRAVAVLSDAAIDTDLRPQIALNAAFGNQVTPTIFGAQQSAIDQQNAINASQGLPLLPNVNRNQPGFWQIGATATLAMPLLDYGTRHTAHTSARAQIAAADASLASTLGSVELDVRQSLRAAQTGAQNVSLYDKAVELGRESARIAQLQYKNGLISLSDADAAEQSSLSASNDLVAARVSYLVSIVRLRIAIGDTDAATAADVRGL